MPQNMVEESAGELGGTPVPKGTELYVPALRFGAYQHPQLPSKIPSCHLMGTIRLLTGVESRALVGVRV